MSTEYAIYNPKNLPVDTLPVIYGMNNGGGQQIWEGLLISEDGHALGSHICSSEGWMLQDLGILEGTRPDRHEGFRQKYPDGYRMDFVPYSDVPGHAAIQEAFRLNDLMRPPEDTENHD